MAEKDYISLNKCWHECDENYFIDCLLNYCFDCVSRDICLFNQEQLDNFLNSYKEFTGACSYTVLEFLLKNGANPNKPCSYEDQYILFDICYRAEYKKLKLLLSSGVDVNIKTKSGNSPLKIVCGASSIFVNKKDKIKCIKLLIRSGLVDEETILKIRLVCTSKKILAILGEWGNYVLPEIKEPSVE